MNLDEKIERSIDKRMEAYAQLFNDVDDAQEDIGLLRRILTWAPLLRDIKTEVKSIENMLKTQPPRPEEQEEDDEEEQDTTPTTDPESNEIADEIKKLPKLRKKVRDALKKLDPSPDTPAITDGDNVPALSNLNRYLPLYTLIELISKTIDIGKTLGDQAVDATNRQKDLKMEDVFTRQFLKDQIETQIRNTQEILEILSRDELEHFDDLIEQVVDRVLDYIYDRTFQIGQDLSNCCTLTNENVDGVAATLGNVERAVGMLQPAKQAGNELAILTKVNSTYAELQSLRGLL